MIINELIVNALAPLNIPIYFISRLENPTPCIVFNYIQSPAEFSDDDVDLKEYNIIINLYIEPERYVQTTEKVCKLMTNNGFIESIRPTGIFDEVLRVFNQPIQFKFYK